VDVQVFNSDPQLGRWRAELAEWERKAEPAEHKELLAAPGIEAPIKVDGQQVVNLADDAVLSHWLGAVGGQLLQKRPGIPLLVPAPVPLSAGQRRRIAALVALAAVALCLGHYFLWLERNLRAANAERAQLLAPAAKLAEFEKKIKEEEKKGTQVKDETGKFQRCADKLVAQRNRLARLLKSLARQDWEDLLVQKIDNEAGEPKIKGLCLQPEMADQFAAWLARELRPTGNQPDGWEVQPPRKIARNQVANGGPWEFEILCRIPVEPAAAKIGPTVNAPRHR
jgi:hypothetical protein